MVLKGVILFETPGVNHEYLEQTISSTHVHSNLLDVGFVVISTPCHLFCERFFFFFLLATTYVFRYVGEKKTIFGYDKMFAMLGSNLRVNK
jgi:hypothetical protein